MNKVYCNDCKFYRNFYYYGCVKVKKTVDTPLKRKEVFYDYKKQNKDNNCKYYIKHIPTEEPKVKKWYEFWK